MIDEDDLNHVLYRFVDGGGQLLYVGITKNPAARLRRHEHDQYWWEQVATIHLQRFGNRRQLLAMEAYAIATEHPIYNRQGNHGQRPPGNWHWNIQPCPVCTRPSYYVHQEGRFFHQSGHCNRYCWAEISSGRHTGGPHEILSRQGNPIPDYIWDIQ